MYMVLYHSRRVSFEGSDCFFDAVEVDFALAERLPERLAEPLEPPFFAFLPPRFVLFVAVFFTLI
jgi:hypothetical protein